jgi:hypothetical protein
VAGDLHHQPAGELGIHPRHDATIGPIGLLQYRPRQARPATQRKEPPLQSALAATVDHRIEQHPTSIQRRTMLSDHSRTQPLLRSESQPDRRVDRVLRLGLTEAEQRRIHDEALRPNHPEPFDALQIAARHRHTRGNHDTATAAAPAATRN